MGSKRATALRGFGTGLAGALLLAALPATGATITVTSALDAASNDGVCTLREAIVNLNAGTDTWVDCTHTGPGYAINDTIAFNIGGGIGVKTITPTSAYPPIVKSITIDGYTQPGSVLGTNNATYPGIPPIDATVMVEIDAAALSSAAGSVLTVGAGGNGALIRGLAIGNFPGAFGGGALIDLQRTGYVFGSFLGLRADGLTPWPAVSGTGVKVGPQATYSYVGTLGNTGTAGATRNVITSCDTAVYGLGPQGLVVYGNIIGLGKDGTTVPAAASKGTTGILVDVSGGNAPYVDDFRYNVVSGLLGNAIWMRSAYQPTVLNNLVGVDLGAPQVVVGNGGNGILIENAVAGQLSQNGSYGGNTIAGSGGDGIQLLGSVSAGDPRFNGLTGSSIWGNAGLGINLRPAGEAGSTVTANDSLDPDSGPNDLQNFPVVTSAQVNGAGAVVVQFTLNSAPFSATFHQFSVSAYASPACSAKGNGEGRYFGANSGALSTDVSGDLSGSITVPAGTTGWTAGSVVTLLAHDVSQNNTSEFSACFTIQGAPVVATKLAFAQQPTDAVAGSAITPSVKVQLTDGGGSPVAQLGVQVTLALGPGSTGTLSGTATQPSDALGVATFAGLSIDLVGQKTLAATSGALTPTTSATFVISAAAPWRLITTGGNPQSTPVNTPFSLPLQVRLEDAFGNGIGGGSIAYTPPTSGPGAVIAGSPTTTDASGYAQATATADGTAGMYAVTAKYGTLPSVPFSLTNTAAPTGATAVPALAPPGLLLLAVALGAVGFVLLRRCA